MSGRQFFAWAAMVTFLMVCCLCNGHAMYAIGLVSWAGFIPTGPESRRRSNKRLVGAAAFTLVMCALILARFFFAPNPGPLFPIFASDVASQYPYPFVVLSAGTIILTSITTLVIGYAKWRAGQTPLAASAPA